MERNDGKFKTGTHNDQHQTGQEHRIIPRRFGLHGDTRKLHRSQTGVDKRHTEKQKRRRDSGQYQILDAPRPRFRVPAL